MSQEEWLPNFNLLSPAFNIFSWLPASFVARSHWPDLNDYSCLSACMQRPILNYQGKQIIFVDQPQKKSAYFDQGYEARIYLTGAVQTRLYNWHDFFNMLTWHTFTTIKSQLNALQYCQIKNRMNRSTTRTALENFLTLFDENGIIVVTSDKHLLHLIKTMQWKELFWHRRALLDKRLSCFIVGHSLQEKILKPYIGMVGHSLLFSVSPSFFHSSINTQLDQVEHRFLDLPLATMEPKHLFPIPILGFPSWCQESFNASFYDNQHYFREKRKSCYCSASRCKCPFLA